MKYPVNAIYQDQYLGAKGAIFEPDDLSPAHHNLLILHGGEDIPPEIYGEHNVAASVSTHGRDRTRREVALVHRAVDLGIPILGICRGAQLLCALGGGTLWQDVSGHGTSKGHGFRYRGKDLHTNTCHHQMMRPSDDMEILATAVGILSPTKVFAGGVVQSEEPEVEMIHIPKFKAIGVQGHPEWLHDSSDLCRAVKDALQMRNYL